MFKTNKKKIIGKNSKNKLFITKLIETNEANEANEANKANEANNINQNNKDDLYNTTYEKS